MVKARMIHFLVVLSLFLIYPRQTYRCWDSDSGSSQGLVDGEGEDEVLSLYLSLPPKLSLGGLDDGDSVIVPLDGGHGDRPSQVLGVVAGGNKDDPLHSGNVSVYISPTPVVLRQP